MAATGATPAGSVQIYKGTKLLATGTLANGKVTIKVSKKMARSSSWARHPYREIPRLDDRPASQDDFVVKVKKKKHH